MRLLLDENLKKQLVTIAQKPKGSWLLYGQPHTGKAYLAKETARSINCLGCNDNSCYSCRLAVSFNHPDIVIIKPNEKSKITIEDIQQLRHKLAMGKHHSTKKRVVVVENAQAMTIPAQNALLKTLEEPPADTIIILTADDKSALLSTIQSRCQAVFVPLQRPEAIAEFLETTYKTPKSQAAIISQLTSGSIGTAVQYAQSPDLMDDRQKLEADVEKMLNSDQLSKLLLASRLAASKVDEELFSRIVISKIKASARKSKSGTMLGGLEAVKTFRERLSANVSPKLAFEALALELEC